ncbi:MAG TPA: M24 family metallopeptidase [Gaiellaceae bacterium]|nr:M24 family metallopeptidase [Gaiellaceae bacterium]
MPQRTSTASSAEATRKRELALEAAETAGFEGLVASTPASVRWLLCGRGRPVDTAAPDAGYAVVLVRERALVLTPNIEAGRAKTEERFEELEYELISYPWHEGPAPAIARLTAGARVVSDTDLDASLASLRRRLSAEERGRYRAAAADAAAAMVNVVRCLSPEQRETEVAGELARETHARGFTAPVILVAGDARQKVHRHPVPTDARLGRHALVAVTAERDGLHTSLTRLVSFGPPPHELVALVEAVAAVDAAVLTASVPGRTVGEAFDVLADAYAERGFPDEWRLHHQGGLTGYRGREVFAVAGSGALIPESCAVAWNPSITGGAKSEDTALVGPDGVEIVTRTAELPELTLDGITRPAIVEL